MKKHLSKILIISAIVIALGVIGYLIYWSATHTCVLWEDNPTGEKCVEYESYVTVCTTISNGITSVRPCTKRRCKIYMPCRRCLKHVKNEKVPADLTPPRDAC